MKKEKLQVNQIMYEEFEEYTGIKIGIVTEWSNGDGIDANISRKYLPDVNIQLTGDDISLLRQMFLDTGF